MGGAWMARFEPELNEYKVSKARYAVIVSASILIMLCAGAVYAWSIFVAPLQSEYGFNTTQTQLVFGLIIAIFTLGMLAVNRILRKHGPRFTAIIGAVLFFTGYMIASFSNGSLWVLILGMSLFSGIGMAFGYVTVLNNLVRWFPGHQGLATGLAVSGFGAGAILLSQIAKPLLAGGWHVVDIFRTVGIIYGVLFLAGSLFLTAPSWYKANVVESKVEVGILLKDQRFWVIFYVFFAGTFAGLLFMGNLKPIGQSYGVSSGAAVLAISLFSIGNAAGRILWGQIHDMIGGRKSVVMSLLLLSLCMMLLLFFSGNDCSFVLIALLLGLNFGSNFVTYAADCCKIWGVAKLDIIYPAVSVAYGIAGILGPMVGGMIRDMTSMYYVAIVVGSVVCLTGAVVYAFFSPRVYMQPVEVKCPNLAASEKAS
jgi:MFS transporter, OFA family, oxalate/formate antiporter